VLACAGCVGVVGNEVPAPDAGAGGDGGADTGGSGGGGGGTVSAGGGTATGGGQTGGGAPDSGAPDAGRPDAGPPDSGIPDAGPPDAGDPFSTDRNTFFGDSRCADAGFVVCEDFESGNINGAIWQQSSSNDLQVDTAEHARGGHALHVTVNGNGGANIHTSKPFPAPNNRYWGRAFFKFIRLPQNADMSYAHWTVIAATGTNVDGEIRVSGQLSNSKNLWGVGTDNRSQPIGTGDWTNSDNDPNGMPRAVPTGEWECIEWLHDGQNNETRFFWDDVEHPSLHTTATMSGSTTGQPYVLPDFNSVWLGWAEYQSSSVPFELWIDEIAIDYARVGCVR